MSFNARPLAALLAVLVLGTAVTAKTKFQSVGKSPDAATANLGGKKVAALINDKDEARRLGTVVTQDLPPDFSAAGCPAGAVWRYTATGTATLSHTIPAGPVIKTPAQGAEVRANVDLVIAWNPVTTSVTGGSVTITHYELIVEREDQPEHAGFGSETFDVHVPASVTSLRVPHEFLQPGTDYKFEVLAIDGGGAQTITQSTFSTL